MAQSTAYVSPVIQSMLGVVNTHLRWRNSKNDRTYDIYHPSAFGKCLRNMQYLRYAEEGILEMPEQCFDADTLRIFDNGHSMHSRWENYFKEIGILMGVWQCNNVCCRLWDDNGEVTGGLSNTSIESLDKSRIYGLEKKLGVLKPDKCVCGCRKFRYHEVTIEDKELNIRGHVDLIIDFSKLDADKYKKMVVDFNIDNLPKKPVVIDMKTMNDYRWKQKLMQTGPGIDYRVQLCIYANLLDLDFGLLFYENKNNQKIKAFQIDRNADTMFAWVKRQASQMRDMANLNPKRLPPPRPNDKTCYECNNCPFKKLCHDSAIWDNESALNDQRTRFYGDLL